MSILDDFRSMNDPDEFDWAGRCVCEVPERPPAYGAYVCGPRCGEALAVAAVYNRDLKVGIKFSLGRRMVIPAATFVMLAAAGEEAMLKALDRWVDPYDESYEDPDTGATEVFRVESYVRESWIAG